MRSSRETNIFMSMKAVRDGSRSLLVGSEESILEEVAGFGASLLLIENSRAFKLEADHLSADWMEAIGCDPQALVRFFEKIAKECGVIYDGGSMLASQPSCSERI